VYENEEMNDENNEKDDANE